MRIFFNKCLKLQLYLYLTCFFPFLEWNQQHRPVRAKELHHTSYNADNTRGVSVDLIQRNILILLPLQGDYITKRH